MRREYYEVNRLAILDKQVRYRQSHRKELGERYRRWRLEHPEKARENTRNWRRRQKAFGLMLLGWRCKLCGSEKNLQRHHLDDRIKGRNTTWGKVEIERIGLGELILLCRGCHLQVSNMKALVRKDRFATFMEILKRSIQKYD